MRPKFVFAMLLLAVLVPVLVVYWQPRPGNAPPPAPEIATPAPGPASHVIAVAAPPPTPEPAAAAPATATNTTTPEERETAVDAETDRLQQWSMNDDPASLASILTDLTNSEKEVREAAIEATKQFGSTNAIPALKAAVAATDDIQEQIALLEAADFLSLPRVDFSGPAATGTTEQMQIEAQKRAQRQARHGAQFPDSGTPSVPGHDSSTPPNH